MSTATYDTRQKRLIRELLNENSENLLTCDEISYILKAEGTPVGKTTVYRFLETLFEKGEVRKSTDPKSRCTVYQIIDKKQNCEKHLHMRCTECGKLFHLGCDFMNSVGDHIQQHHKFTIDNSKTVIYGQCENCK